MFDLAAIEGFDWDEDNARNTDRQGVSTAEAEQVFFNAPLLVLPDREHTESEARIHTLGKTHDGRRLHLTFTSGRGGELIRVISARSMHRKERLIYEQAS